MTNHTESTIDSFHQFLDSQPAWLELGAARDVARKAWQDRTSQSHCMMKASHFMQAAEILENATVMHYEGCMDEEETTAIHNWTGVHPEVSVDLYSNIVEHLRDQATSVYEEVREYKAETKRLHLAANSAQAAVSKLYDALREEYNKLER
jgi:hypothetical protein